VARASYYAFNSPVDGVSSDTGCPASKSAPSSRPVSAALAREAYSIIANTVPGQPHERALSRARAFASCQQALRLTCGKVFLLMDTPYP